MTILWRTPIIYIRFKRGWLSVGIHGAKQELGRFDGAADVALRPGKNGLWEAVAVGDDAQWAVGLSEITLFHAFRHPRVILDDFDKTFLLLREFLRRANGGRKIWGRCLMVIQLLELLEGGLTDIEQRALLELGLLAGARAVVFVEGTQELTSSELSQMRGTTEPYNILKP